jgi:hypothetical protein
MDSGESRGFALSQSESIDEIMGRMLEYENALRLIAAPKRSDGTYDRCREACEDLAKKVLEQYDARQKN